MKCLSVDNQPRLARPGLIDLNPGELHSYLFMVSLDKCGGSCKILDNLSDRLCISNKTEDAYLRVINMINLIQNKNRKKINVNLYVKAH